jgi:hypothetical protein
LGKEDNVNKMLFGRHSNVQFLFIFFAVLGLELRAYSLSHSTSPFLVIGSLALFAQVGFKP